MLRPTAALLALPLAAVSLTACGSDDAPPAPARTAAAPVGADRGRAHGYAVTQRDGLMLYSAKTREGRYRLIARRGTGPARAAGPVDSQPFQVDLGTDAAGRDVAVYPRCEPGPCRLVVFDPATGRERTAATAPRGRIRTAAIDRGIITYALDVAGHRARIVAVPADGSGLARTVLTTHAVVTALDTSSRGLTYVGVQPDVGAAHSSNTLYLRRRGRPSRVLARTGYGEEGGADIVSVSFSGRDLVWGVSGEDPNVYNYGEVHRLDLRTGRHTMLAVPNGGLISAAPDAARAGGATLIAFQNKADNDGFAPDEDDETLRRYAARDYR